MEQGFDGWVRNRFHVESSDIPDIASHIDPNLFEPDWTLPSGVDDLFSWLTTNQDVTMDQAAPDQPDEAYLGVGIAAGTQTAAVAAAAGQMQVGQQHMLPAQHHVSGWQLAYLQQAVQQQPDMQMAMPAQLQQQAMFPAGAGYPPPAQLPAAGAAFPADMPFLQQQQGAYSTQDYNFNSSTQYADPVAAAAAAGGAGMASTQLLQHAGSSGRSGHSSGSSKQNGSGAPVSKQSGGAKQGGGQRKPRKVTDAQRAAHKRFRIRRKEQVSSLVAEVAAKQEQLQALEAEHEALTAKARALDQMVASAGDNMMLMQHMEGLSLGSKQPFLQQQQQQQQQQHTQLHLKSASSQGTSSSGAASSLSNGSGCLASLLGSGASDDAKDAAAAATAAICDTAATAGATGLQHPAGVSGEGIDSSTAAAAAAAAAVDGGSRELQSGTAAAAAAITAAALGGSNGSNEGAPPSPSAAAAASLERLEGAVRAALGRPLSQPLQQQQQQQQQLQVQLRSPAGQALQLQGTLPALQRLMKSLVSEIMQLVLQINKEQVGAGGQGSAAFGAAAGRLQHIRQQVYGEFRAFSTTNRIDMCQLYSLNLETGVLVRPPPRHWVAGAQLLMQRLPSQTQQDIVMAHKLYTDALHKVQQQRRMLLMQLHLSLRDSTSPDGRRYVNDSLYTTTLGPRTNAALLLNAVDSNLRKEYVMEGVFQWTLNKLLPPLLSAELVVTSYPFMTDLHYIAEELRHLIPADIDPTAGVQAIEEQQQQQQQQRLDLAVHMQQPGLLLPKIEPEQHQHQQQSRMFDLLGMPSVGCQQQQQHQQLWLPQQSTIVQQQQQQQQQVSTGLVQGTQPTGLPFLSMPCS